MINNKILSTFFITLGIVLPKVASAGSFQSNDCQSPSDQNIAGLCKYAKLHDINLSLIVGGVYFAGLEKTAYLCSFKLTSSYQQQKLKLMQVPDGNRALQVATQIIRNTTPIEFKLNPTEFCRKSYTHANNQVGGVTGKMQPPMFQKQKEENRSDGRKNYAVYTLINGEVSSIEEVSIDNLNNAAKIAIDAFSDYEIDRETHISLVKNMPPNNRCLNIYNFKVALASIEAGIFDANENAVNSLNAAIRVIYSLNEQSSIKCDMK